MECCLIRNVLGASRRLLLRSTATCCFAAQQRAASQHSKVLLRSTAKCCFAAQQSAASQHSYVLLRSTMCCFAAQCSMVCAAPYCGAARRNCAFACNAALRAAKLRFAQRTALRAAHAASQHACKYRICGKSPQARGFCGRHKSESAHRGIRIVRPRSGLAPLRFTSPTLRGTRWPG